MNRPKRHHYVPKFLQAAFLDVNGRIHIYRKQHPGQGVYDVSPKDAFVETHLYSTIDKEGGRDPAQEIEFAALDGPASGIVRKILTASENGVLPELTADERETWASFFYHQMKRVPDVTDRLAAMRSWPDRLQDVIPKTEAKLGRALTEAERADLTDTDFLRRVQQNATVKAQAEPGDVVLHLLRAMTLQIGVAAGTARLLIGSRPVVRLADGPNQHLADPAVLLWLPIAPNVAIRMVYEGVPESRIALSDDQIAAINDAIFEQSSAVGTGDPTLLDRFIGLTGEATV